MAQKRRIIPRVSTDILPESVVKSKRPIMADNVKSPNIPPIPKLAEKEADLRREAELTKNEKKILDEKAENIRRKKELEAMENPEIEQGSGVVVEDWENRPGTSSVSEQLASIVDELDAGACFHVWRLDNTKRYKVGRFGIGEWPDRMEEIASVAGGGSFLIQFRTEGNEVVKTITQSFDPSFYRKKAENPADGMAAILLQIQQQNSAMMEAMRREQMELMKTLLTTVAAPKDGGFLKSAQDIALIGQMFQNKGQGEGAVELLLKGMEIGRGLSEGKEPPSTFDRLVDSIGKPVAEALSKAAGTPALPASAAAPHAPQTPPTPSVRPPAVPTPPILQTPQVPKETDPMDDIKSSMAYKLYVPQILAAAKSGASIDEWAERIMGTVPEAYDGVLVDIVSREDVPGFLATFEPTVKDNAEWFNRLAQKIKEAFVEGEGDEGDEEPAPEINPVAVDMAKNGKHVSAVKAG